MNIERIKSIVALILAADFAKIDDSSYTCDVTAHPDDVTGDPDNEVILVSWVDDEHQEFCVKFTEKLVNDAKLVPSEGAIDLIDHEGEPTRILLFNCIPAKESVAQLQALESQGVPR